MLNAFGRSGESGRIIIALLAVASLTAVVAGGMHRSNCANQLIVSLTLLALLIFVLAGIPSALDGADTHLKGLFDGERDGLRGLLHATSLMFVAYTGYGRIAMLGEEIREPTKSIPQTIVITLVATMADRPDKLEWLTERPLSDPPRGGPDGSFSDWPPRPRR